MITTEILGLLEITRKLVNSKSELDKTYFEQFISPAWDLFSKIQENYKSSFEKYLEFVNSDEYDPKVLIEKLRHDSLQTQDFRTELVEIVKNLPTAKFKVKEIFLLNFSKSIANYFSVTNGLKFSSANKAEFNSNDVKFFEIQEESNPNSSSVSIVSYGGNIVHGDNNVIRFSTIVELSRKGNADREQSKQALERAIREFQSRYAEVASAYYKLRKELLS